MLRVRVHLMTHHVPTLAHPSVGLAVAQYQWREGITSRSRIEFDFPERNIKTGQNLEVKEGKDGHGIKPCHSLVQEYGDCFLICIVDIDISFDYRNIL